MLNNKKKMFIHSCITSLVCVMQMDSFIKRNFSQLVYTNLRRLKERVDNHVCVFERDIVLVRIDTKQEMCDAQQRKQQQRRFNGFPNMENEGNYNSYSMLTE